MIVLYLMIAVAILGLLYIWVDRREDISFAFLMPEYETPTQLKNLTLPQKIFMIFSILLFGGAYGLLANKVPTAYKVVDIILILIYSGIVMLQPYFNDRLQNYTFYLHVASPLVWSFGLFGVGNAVFNGNTLILANQDVMQYTLPIYLIALFICIRFPQAVVNLFRKANKAFSKSLFAQISLSVLAVLGATAGRELNRYNENLAAIIVAGLLLISSLFFNLLISLAIDKRLKGQY